MNDYVLTIIEVIGICQCVFIAIALLCLPGSHKHANTLLALFLLMFAFIFAFFVLRQNDWLFLAPIMVFVRLPLMFLYGPLLLLYLRHVTQAPDERPPAGGLHFLPFIVAALAYLPALGLNHIELLHLAYYGELVRLYPDTAQLTSIQGWLWVLSTQFLMPLFVVHLGFYLVLCLRLLMAHKRRVLQYFSHTEKISLDWMRNLLLALATIWLLVALSGIVFAGSTVSAWINDLLTPALVVFLSALGLFGLRQKSIWLLPADIAHHREFPHAVAPPDGPAESADAAPGKYQASTLTKEQQAQYLTRLLEYMDKRRPFLDSELNLHQLASQMDLPPRHLSQVINSLLNQNFLDFVNSYRIAEAKRLLEVPACAMSILTIAMEVGFNSKSAFYTAFNRHVGQTPTQYRRSHLLMATPGAQT